MSDSNINAGPTTPLASPPPARRAFTRQNTMDVLRAPDASPTPPSPSSPNSDASGGGGSVPAILANNPNLSLTATFDAASLARERANGAPGGVRSVGRSIAGRAGRMRRRTGETGESGGNKRVSSTGSITKVLDKYKAEKAARSKNLLERAMEARLAEEANRRAVAARERITYHMLPSGETPSPGLVFSKPVHDGIIHRVAANTFFVDKIATCGADGVVKVWTMSEDEMSQKVPTLQTEFTSHTDAVRGIAWHPDGMILVSVGKDASLQLHESSATDTVKIPLDSPAFDTSFSVFGKRVASGNVRYVSVFDTETHKLVHKIPAHALNVYSVDFHPGSPSLMVTAGDDGLVKLWDVDAGRVVQTLGDHTSWVYRACFSPDGRSIITASADGSAMLYRLGLAKPHATFHPAWGAGNIVYSASLWDNDLAIVVGHDPVVRAYVPSAPNDPVLELRGHVGAVRDATFLSHASTILTVSSDSLLSMWNVRAPLRSVVLAAEQAAEQAAEPADGEQADAAAADGEQADSEQDAAAAAADADISTSNSSVPISEQSYDYEYMDIIVRMAPDGSLIAVDEATMDEQAKQALLDAEPVLDLEYDSYPDDSYADNSDDDDTATVTTDTTYATDATGESYEYDYALMDADGNIFIETRPGVLVRHDISDPTESKSSTVLNASDDELEASDDDDDDDDDLDSDLSLLAPFREYAADPPASASLEPDLTPPVLTLTNVGAGDDEQDENNEPSQPRAPNSNVRVLVQMLRFRGRDSRGTTFTSEDAGLLSKTGRFKLPGIKRPFVEVLVGSNVQEVTEAWADTVLTFQNVLADSTSPSMLGSDLTLEVTVFEDAEDGGSVAAYGSIALGFFGLDFGGRHTVDSIKSVDVWLAMAGTLELELLVRVTVVVPPALLGSDTVST